MAGREKFTPTRGDRVKFTEISGADNFPDEVAIDLDGKDPDAFRIIEEDDTPPEDRGRPTQLDQSLADQEDDLRGIGDKTKKRIDRLKFETHTERRAKEEAQRERDVALNLAREQAAELNELRRRGDAGATALAASMKGEREAMLNDAKRRLAQAHADGDSDAIAQATTDISQAQAELIAIGSRTPRPQAPHEEQPQQRQPVQQQPTLAPKVAEWMERNKNWFQRPGHEAKTSKAISLHHDAVSRGITPSSDEYRREIDKGLKAVYPDHEPYDYSPDNGDGRGDRRDPRRTNVVAEGSRMNERQTPSRTVTLTSTEVAIAKKLGVPLQEYAKQKQLRDLKTNGEGAR